MRILSHTRSRRTHVNLAGTMFSGLRSHLTYANIGVTICLFLVLGGGTAYASHLIVRSSDIVDNEVRTADVRDDNLSGGGLTSQDVRPNALTGSDVSALTGGDVNDNSLTGADITESSLGTVPNAGKVDGADAPLWVAVGPNRSIVRDRGATSVSNVSGTVKQRVTFDRDVSQCAYTMTANETGSADFGSVTSGATANAVDVITMDHTGSGSNGDPFFLVVNC